MGFGSLGELNLTKASRDFGYADMNMSITGFAELDAMLNDLTDQAKSRVLVGSMRRVLKPIKIAAERKTPVHSGRLRDSIHISKKFNKSTGFAQAILGFRTRGKKGAPHAHLIEWGTAERQTPVTRYTLLGGRKTTGEMRNVGKTKKQLMMTKALKQTGGSQKAKKEFQEELSLAIIRAHKKTKNRKR
jgi:HK97 gp10 family phage protein